MSTRRAKENENMLAHLPPETGIDIADGGIRTPETCLDMGHELLYAKKKRAYQCAMNASKMQKDL